MKELAFNTDWNHESRNALEIKHMLQELADVPAARISHRTTSGTAWPAWSF